MASLWSDESTTKKPTYTQSHLRLHLHTNYLTFDIYIHRHQQNIKYTRSIRSGQASQEHKVSRHLFATELLGVKGGSTVGEEKIKNKSKKKNKTDKKKFKKVF